MSWSQRFSAGASKPALPADAMRSSWSTPSVLELFLEGQDYGVQPPDKLRLTEWVERLMAVRSQASK